MKTRRVQNEKNLPSPYILEELEPCSPKGQKNLPVEYKGRPPLAPRTLVDRRDFSEGVHLKPSRPTIRVERSYASFVGAMISYIALLILGFHVSSEFSFLMLTSDLRALGLDIVFEVPLALFPALGVLLYLMVRVHGSYLEIRPHHVKLVTGRLSSHKKQVEVPFDSIFFVEVDQGMVDRMLNFGTLSVGRKQGQGAEIRMSGVSSPYEVSEILKTRISNAHGGSGEAYSLSLN